MSLSCLFKRIQTQQPCEHPGCQIIRTIRNVNQAVLEGRKPINTGISFRTQPPKNKEDLFFQEDEVKLQDQMNPQDFSLKPPSKTALGEKQLMLINRISQLERDVKYLKQTTYIMKSMLIGSGANMIR